MERTNFKANDQSPNQMDGGGFVESRYSFNQVSRNQSVLPQYSNVQFNSAPKHYPSMLLPPGCSASPVGVNGVPSNNSSGVGNMSFQNSNYHFQPFLPTHALPSSPLQISVSSSENNLRPLFSTPPPSGNVDPVQLGQFNFPPPPLPSSSPYFSHGYSKSMLSLPNNQLQQQFNNTSVQTVFPSVPGMVPPQSSSFQPSMMSQFISSVQSTSSVSENKTFVSEKENLLNKFLQKFNLKEKQEVKKNITVAEFCCGLKRCFSLFNLLQISRGNLVSLLDSNLEEWEVELKHAKKLQEELSETCSMLSFPMNLAAVQRKLKVIKRKRALKQKSKATLLEARIKKELERERLHQEIDKWLDSLKEKNEKMKREMEMKKEADNILAEVRRKIHDAKKTIEKLKVFEKLRSARQANSLQKGLYQQPEHTAKFEAKISHLRETMLAQLSNYEQEEKALQVMLETEQEDRREEEALWRKRKLMTFQQKKQKAILQSLFGDSDEPTADDPLFLFYQYQNSGNKSLDNLVQIRHHWDVHLSEEGESIPVQWVVPVPPSSSSWEEYFTT